MPAPRPGYSLVEMVIALSVGTLLVGGMYQAIVVQEKGYETTDAVVQDQESVRTALAILEGEIRELATVGGSDIGGTDILYLSADSIRFRAPRKLGVVCGVWPSDRAVVTWSEGELFESGDGFMVFIEGDVSTYTDDRWEVTEVVNANGSLNACTSAPSGMSDQRVQLDDNVLSGVLPGAPVRGFEEVTYRLYTWDGGWGLGRRDADGTIHYLVSGLAGPGEGLHFEYFDDDRDATTDPADVASIRITLTTDPVESSDLDPTQISSTVFLRNN